MNELDQYECFAIPAHVWSEQDAIVRQQPQGWTRRNWVYREAAALGAEATPSPHIDTI
jgi:hypothetical protein